MTDWQPIETAPIDAAFIGIDKEWNVARCWRRIDVNTNTDEILEYSFKKPMKVFHATHRMPVNPPTS